VILVLLLGICVVDQLMSVLVHGNEGVRCHWHHAIYCSEMTCEASDSLMRCTHIDFIVCPVVH
jgi:hypothetical protein